MWSFYRSSAMPIVYTTTGSAASSLFRPVYSGPHSCFFSRSQNATLYALPFLFRPIIPLTYPLLHHPTSSPLPPQCLLPDSPHHLLIPPHQPTISATTPSKKPHVDEYQPNRDKKPHPHLPPHPRPLRHPQHPIHSPPQAHPCVIKGIIHAVSERGGGADFSADGDSDLFPYPYQSVSYLGDFRRKGGVEGSRGG